MRRIGMTYLLLAIVTVAGIALAASSWEATSAEGGEALKTINCGGVAGELQALGSGRLANKPLRRGASKHRRPLPAGSGRQFGDMIVKSAERLVESWPHMGAEHTSATGPHSAFGRR